MVGQCPLLTHSGKPRRSSANRHRRCWRLRPEGLDPVRLQLRAIVSGAQRRKDLLRVHQVDVRRISLDPARLRVRRLDLADILTDWVRSAALRSSGAIADRPIRLSVLLPLGRAALPGYSPPAQRRWCLTIRLCPEFALGDDGRRHHHRRSGYVRQPRLDRHIDHS